MVLGWEIPHSMTLEGQLVFLRTFGEPETNRILFQVVQQQNQKPVGECAFNAVDWTHHHAALDLNMTPKPWDQKTLAESLLLALEYIFEELKLHRIECNTAKEDARMKNFFEEVGLIFESVRVHWVCERGNYYDRDIYRLLRPQWARTKARLEQAIR